MSTPTVRPCLVVISGLPASGKSTLASRLGRDLGLRVLCRDELRRAMSGSPSSSDVTVAVLDALREILDAENGVILDGNFNTPAHSAGLADLIASRDAVAIEVCLWGDPDVLTARFVERAEPPLTEDLRPYFETVLERARRPALVNAVRVVEFDTTQFDALESGYSDLLALIREEL